MLENFQQVLEDGLVKVCSMSGVMNDMLSSPDLDEKWEKTLLQGYVGDAVQNFNDYPQAALGFAVYLGMAVAHQWDRDWTHYKDKPYRWYYGDRGFDNMDDHITGDILRLGAEPAKKLSRAVLNCTQATLDLLRHEGIETDTEYGFYVLVRCYSVMFRLGASIELNRLGYKKQRIDPGQIPS